MKSTTSRRAILAGIAASPTLATPALAAIGSQSSPIDDPIFAAIETHKAAFRLSQERSKIQSDTPDWGTDHDPVVHKAVHQAERAAHRASDAAANALLTIRPATIAGVVALLQHVEAFNCGAFFLEDCPDWSSAPMHWPAMIDDNDDDEIDMFGYSILANVRAALEAMEVQS